MKIRTMVDVPVEELVAGLPIDQLRELLRLVESRLTSCESADPAVSEFEMGLLRMNRKIHAIKAYNGRTGVGLRAAKQVVDAAWERAVELGDIS